MITDVNQIIELLLSVPEGKVLTIEEAMNILGIELPQDQMDWSVTTTASFNNEGDINFPFFAEGSIVNTGGVDIARRLMGGDVTITSHYGAQRIGHTHQGIDLRAAIGTRIYAPFNGTIVKAVSYLDGNNGGRRILLQSDDGRIRVYVMHLSRVDVKEGQRITRGQIIGLSGSSGVKEDSYNPHVHYELMVKFGNQYENVNPENYTGIVGYGGTVGQAEIVKVPNITKGKLAEVRPISVGLRNFNPGNDIAYANPFSIGKGAGGSGNAYHSKYANYVDGYAGNAWQLMMYISGRSRYTSKNPTLLEIMRAWVGPKVKIENYERYSGFSRSTRIDMSFRTIYILTMTIGLLDSSYINKEQAREGVKKAIIVWSKKYPSDFNTEHSTPQKIVVPFAPVETKSYEFLQPGMWDKGNKQL